jgi:hypothetical protein
MLCGVLGSSTARAQDAYRVPDELTRQPQLPEGMQARPARVLSLSEAIQVAVQQNLGITLYREQYVAARRLIDAQWGKSFEPVVHASYSATEITTPPQLSLLQNGDNAVVLNTKGGNWYVGVSQTLETATQLSVGYSAYRALTLPGQGAPPCCTPLASTSPSRSRCSRTSPSTWTCPGRTSCARASTPTAPDRTPA